MTGRDPIGPERLGELVDGATPVDDEERTMAAFLAETRAVVPGAPAALRGRVAGATARPPARRSPLAWLGAGDARRRLALAAPVAAGIAAVAIALPVLTSGDGSVPAARDRDAAAEAAPPAAAAAAPEGARLAAPPAVGADAPVPSAPGRARQVTASTRVRVDGVEALSRASSAAMATVRRLGGFTAGSDYSVPNGATGANRLVFRVPTDRVGAAVAAFGDLGTVLDQDVAIVDVTERLGRQGRAVEALSRRVDDLRRRVAAASDDAALAAELSRAEARLAAATGRRDATGARARLAVVNLTLTTEGPPPPPAEEGQFSGPIGDAGARLAAAAAWTIGAVVLVGPIVAVALLAAWGLARLRRRSGRRLMQGV